MKNKLVEKMVRLPQKAWDVIEREANRHGKSFDDEVKWLLTADFISDEKTRKTSIGECGEYSNFNCTDPGMTLRDYFAGQALAGWVSDPSFVASCN
jgi:plasmid stability protein